MRSLSLSFALFIQRKTRAKRSKNLSARTKKRRDRKLRDVPFLSPFPGVRDKKSLFVLVRAILCALCFDAFLGRQEGRKRETRKKKKNYWADKKKELLCLLKKGVSLSLSRLARATRAA
jgi:hypothetical protein